MKPASMECYKGRGVLRARTEPATENTKFAKGAGDVGSVFLEVANAKEGTTRSYDWDNKVSLALNAKELVEIYHLGMGEAKKVDIFHDPDKGGPNEGTRAKTLNIYITDTKGYCFSLAQKKGEAKIHATVTLSAQEFMQLRWYLRDSFRVIMGL